MPVVVHSLIRFVQRQQPQHSTKASNVNQKHAEIQLKHSLHQIISEMTAKSAFF